MRYRWTAYAGISTALATGVIVKAMAQRPNFYSAAVYLAQSSANLMILTNMIFMLACLFLLGLQKLFYGQLRPIEIEQLYEKAWFAVTETCLAMTIFRGEIGASFLTLFFCLLAAKVWMWIGEGRLEVLEQGQIPGAQMGLFHTRMMMSLLIGVSFDVGMLSWIVREVVGMARPDMMVMFGFEFAVLCVGSLGVLARYVVLCVEILVVRRQKELRKEEIRKERKEAIEARQRADVVTATAGQSAIAEGEDRPTPTVQAPLPDPDEPVEDAELEVEGWEEKGRWMFYLDLTTDFFKLVIYLTFFFILLVFYGLPIHIMRDVFLTCRSFFKRIADFIRYRTATRDMNERYPDATPEEIGSGDVCIICREEMRPYTPNPAPAPAQDGTNTENGVMRPNPVAERMRPKKLPCGHILHFSCLKAWLSRQTICPTCRRPVIPTTRIVVGGANRQGGAAGVDGAAPQNGQPEENRNRARIYQFGPLRIGVGAGNANMFENLAQQIHDGQAPAPQNDVGENNANANANANPNADGPRHYGFGLGIGRTRRSHRSHATTVQARLDQVQSQIQADIDNLRLSTSELQNMRLLQAEATRLRALRPENNSVGVTSTPDTSTLRSQAQSVSRLRPTISQNTSQPTQVFTGSSQQNVLEAGSDQLPQGLQLPEGWTMMPLQRMQPGQPLPFNTMNMAMPGFPVNFPTVPSMPFPAHSGPWSVPTMGYRPASFPMNMNEAEAGGQQMSPQNISQPEVGQSPENISTSVSAPVNAPEVDMNVNGETTEQTMSRILNASNGNVSDPASTSNETTNPESVASLPSWGTGSTTVPLAAPVPTRPVNGDILHQPEAEHSRSTNGTVASSEQHGDVGEAENSSQKKGKAKAVTVEDVDDLLEGS